MESAVDLLLQQEDNEQSGRPWTGNVLVRRLQMQGVDYENS